MNKIFFSILIALFLIPLVYANAEIQNVSTNKSSFNQGETIILSGKVSYDSSNPIIFVVIINPSGSEFVHIAQIIPNNDGTFTKNIPAGGPLWTDDGSYTIRLTYGGNYEKIIQYTRPTNNDQQESSPVESLPNSTPDLTNTNEEEKIVTSDEQENEIFYKINPKMKLFGFPSFDKPPQYYIDRYNKEPEYKTWFDSQFPNFTINEVVGYKKTHVDDFPSIEKSPQHYVDRYYKEPEYKTWFDSQFDEQTIYDVLGYSSYIPDWIKSYAQNWAANKISDSQFMSGLDFMLKNNIIIIPGLDLEKTSMGEIPTWFRNTALWWSTEQISQQEFINSIKYLIQEDIVVVE